MKVGINDNTNEKLRNIFIVSSQIRPEVQIPMLLKPYNDTQTLCSFICELLLHNEELSIQTWETSTPCAPEDTHLYQTYDVIMLPTNYLTMG